DAGRWPTREHARKVLLLEGCVQPAMMPNINAATARVLDAAGIQCVVADGAGCCGAIRFHLDDQDGGRAHMRANIDAWWPFVESGAVEAIVMNASGSAGTYSVLHADIAHQLRDRKLGHLHALEPQAIVSANIGCITHLQSGTRTPVKHWVEVLDAALNSS